MNCFVRLTRTVAPLPEGFACSRRRLPTRGLPRAPVPYDGARSSHMRALALTVGALRKGPGAGLGHLHHRISYELRGRVARDRICAARYVSMLPMHAMGYGAEAYPASAVPALGRALRLYAHGPCGAGTCQHLHPARLVYSTGVCATRRPVKALQLGLTSLVDLRRSSAPAELLPTKRVGPAHSGVVRIFPPPRAAHGRTPPCLRCHLAQVCAERRLYAQGAGHPPCAPQCPADAPAPD